MHLLKQVREVLYVFSHGRLNHCGVLQFRMQNVVVSFELSDLASESLKLGIVMAKSSTAASVAE